MSEADVAAAQRESFSSDALRPIDIHLERRQSLTVRWADGHVSTFPLVYLRKKCPCATCRTPESPATKPSSGLTILPSNFDKKAVAETASLVGHYAIQIRWADGHDTGIYDFRYLRTIDPKAGASERTSAGGP